MKLSRVSIRSFRSIEYAEFSVGQKTVIIGKNNEGKSNILAALNIASASLARYASGAPQPKSFRRRRQVSPSERDWYVWQEDIPFQYQETTKGRPKKTAIDLTFDLKGAEQRKLKRILGVVTGKDMGDGCRSDESVNHSFGDCRQIELKLSFDKHSDVSVKAYSGGVSLEDKTAGVAKYVCQRVEPFNYIPTIRTNDMALDEIEKTLALRMAELESDKLYREAMQRIEEAQRKMLNKMEDEIATSLRAFFPDVNSVSLNQMFAVRSFVRDMHMDIDLGDGICSPIESKGEGIKSLITLAILKDRGKSSRTSIIGIEEPEAHLHPGAIRSLRQVIDQIALGSQVVVTTHNPLLVDVSNARRNVIINEGRCAEANSLADVRRVLGIQPSDNLINAEIVLLVEGAADDAIVRSLLAFSGEPIASALREGRLVVWSMGGASQLANEIRRLERDAYADYLVLLDDDDAGRSAVRKAVDVGVLDQGMANTKVTYTTCRGRKASELEDAFNVDVYLDDIVDNYGIDPLKFTKAKKSNVWSDRMRDAFLDAGRCWDEKMEIEVKTLIANRAVEFIEKHGPDKLINAKRASFHNQLVRTLNKRFA